MKSYCLSHRKDVDGLGSAALAVATTGGQIILSDYDDLLENLKRVPDDAERVVISDLGVDSADFPQFLSELRRISSHAKVTHIDHHFMSEEAKRKVRRAGVQLIHDVTECASILAYQTFKDTLPERARLVALYGAVTDYMDDAPVAKKMMERTERHFVLLEATLLSSALGNRSDQAGYPEMLVRELSMMKHPHEIEGVPEAALEQVVKEANMEDEVRSAGTKKGKLAYVVMSKYSTSIVSKVVLGAFDVRVGVAMKEKQQGWFEVSLRSTSECRIHLGQTIGRIAEALGGSGGGHRKAAGCRIPVPRMREMIDALAKKI